MSKKDSILPEESLDPQDWDDLKDIGNIMVNDMIVFLQNVKEQPVWRKPPQEVKDSFKKKPARRASAIQQGLRRIQKKYSSLLYRQYSSAVLGMGYGNRHSAKHAGRDACRRNELQCWYW